MSTESETKSAGVPAGATHVCTKCGSLYRHGGGRWWDPVVITVECVGGCLALDLRSIAETGPAPTTAAPAEQPDDGPRCQAVTRNGHRCDKPPHEEADDDHEADNAAEGGATLVWRESYLPAEDAAPAEQPGKAADPRPGEVLCDKPSYKHGGSHPKKVTCVDPRPAQPQAPAEPTQEWRTPFGNLKLAGLLWWLYDRFGDEGRFGWAGDLRAAVAHFREHPPESAAPLREERDRLAGQLATANEATRLLSLEANEATRRADAADATVAERDARIETLEGALALALTYVRNPVEHYHTVPGVWNDDERRPERAGQKCAECAPFVAVEARLRAALVGAPEGQPPAAPSEAPLDALRLLAAKWEQEASEATDVNRLATLRLCARELRAALSAPPPPPREQELPGKDGEWIEAAADRLLDIEEKLREWKLWMNAPREAPIANMRAMAKAMDDLQGECRDLRKAAPSAPPRKAPQEDAAAKLASVREYVAYMFDPASLDELHMRGTFAAGVWKCIRPSSPEEQLSGKELK